MQLYSYFIGKTPSKPSNVMIKDTGSRWVEIQWVSSDDDVSVNNFQIEYQRKERDDSEVLQSVQRIYLAGGTYSAVVTDLRPAVEYSVRVAVQSGANVNKSEAIEFTTEEAGKTEY